MSQARDARSPITLSNEVLWRQPSVISRYKSVQPFRQISNISIYTKEDRLLRLGIQDSRVARIYRVDVYNVSDIKYRVRIVFYTVRLDRISFRINIQRLGPGVRNVHPYRCRTRTAVKRHHKWTLGFICNVGSFIISIEQRSDYFPFLVPHRLCSSRDLVGNVLPFDGNLPRGYYR